VRFRSQARNIDPIDGTVPCGSSAEVTARPSPEPQAIGKFLWWLQYSTYNSRVR